MIFYSIINWMPVLFKEADMPPHLGPVVSGLFALGGVGAMLNGCVTRHICCHFLFQKFKGLVILATHNDNLSDTTIVIF